MKDKLNHEVDLFVFENTGTCPGREKEWQNRTFSSI